MLVLAIHAAAISFSGNLGPTLYADEFAAASLARQQFVGFILRPCG